MGMLVLGVVLFLGVHSMRIFADDWRGSLIARRGEGAYKGLYALASIVGLALIVWGGAALHRVEAPRPACRQALRGRPGLARHDRDRGGPRGLGGLRILAAWRAHRRAAVRLRPREARSGPVPASQHPGPGR